MGLHHRLPAFILLVLLPACADPRQPAVTLVHASDPHLLDGKRQPEEKLNQFAFADMMDSIREGMLGTPRPRILVVTGDFGLEATDPRLQSATPARPTRADSARGRRRLDEVVNIVASEINGSPFRKVYFVPGNNDVFLENADVSAWSEVDTFVTRVQSRLRNREIRDLTACYHRSKSTPADCIARLDSPYVLVGFPTVSFKNAELREFERRQLMRGRDSVWLARNPNRVGRQDTLHLEMLRRFREVLSEATAGGWRAIVVTHIPDLEDPHAVNLRKASEDSAARARGDSAGAPRPRRDTIPSDPSRLSPSDRDDVWNASAAVFAEWKALLEWPRVAGMLGGHFHDAVQHRYRRPYTWSDSGGLARPVARVDRCRIFVAPPLATKFQDTSKVQARGFARMTVQGPEITRQLYWYDWRKRTFAADEVAEGCSRQGEETRLSTQPPRFRVNPFASRDHAGAFALTLLLAPLALLIWAAGNPTRDRVVDWLSEKGERMARALKRTMRRSRLYGLGVGAINLLAVAVFWGTTNMVLSTLVWFTAVVALLVLAGAVIRRV